MVCFDSTTSSVQPDTDCVAGTKPSTQIPCTNGNCVQWKVDPYSATCSATCGPGIQTRPVYCYDTTANQNASPTTACDTITPKPDSSRACFLGDCFDWFSDVWGACSATCSTGVQTRTNRCQNTRTSAFVADNNCGATRPPTSQSCNLGACTDATLATLTASAGSLVPAFAPSQQSYSLQVPNAVSSVSARGSTLEQTTHARVLNPFVTVSNLVSGSPQTITMTTQAEAGNQLTYTIVVTRAAGNDPKLLGLGISTGTLSPTFSSAVSSYTVFVTESVTSLTGIPTPPAGGSAQCVTWSPSTAATSLELSPTINTLTCTSTAQDGSTSTTYTIDVTRGQSKVNQLTSIAISTSGFAINPSFSSSQLQYTVSPNLPFSLGSLDVVASALVPSKETITATVNAGTFVVQTDSVASSFPFEYGDSTLIYRVIAEDNINYLLYQLLIHRESDVTMLETISTSAEPNSVLRPTFSSTQTSYTLLLANTVTQLNVFVTRGNKWQTVAWVYAASSQSGALSANGALDAPLTVVLGDSTLQVQCTAEAGGGSQTYSIVMHRQDATAGITALTTNPSIALGTWDLATLSYSATVSGLTTVSLSAVFASLNCVGSYIRQGDTSPSPMAYATSTADIPLLIGDTVLTLMVTSEDGLNTISYIVTIHLTSTDPSLFAIAVGPSTLNEVFVSSIYEYTSTMQANTGSASVLLSPTSTLAHFTYTWRGGSVQSGTVGQSITGLQTADGYNDFYAFMVAEDNVATASYHISFYQENDDSSLTSLSISVGSFLPAFSSVGYQYGINVASTVLSMTFSATVSFSLAHLQYTFNGGLSNSLPVTASAATSPSITLAAGGKYT